MPSSRSTWACELKWDIWVFRRLCWCHAPRERVSWNSLTCDYLSPLDVTLHVSVWVEILTGVFGVQLKPSRSTWACELKFSRSGAGLFLLRSRSTWACELKFSFVIVLLFILGHAPRERVSWNVPVAAGAGSVSVTLHVSVWVEIQRTTASQKCRRSRSTWACELKCNITACKLTIHRSRSTWACELKCLERSRQAVYVRHAPRERVSWNFLMILLPFQIFVTLHVSVWVEIAYLTLHERSMSHAPRERVSWNDSIRLIHD